MPTNRTQLRHSRRANRITPQVLDLYRRARDLLERGDDIEFWEEDGGCRRQYQDACHELDCCFGQQDRYSPMDAIGHDVNHVPTGIYAPFNVSDWRKAVLIVTELEKAEKAARSPER